MMIAIRIKTIYLQYLFYDIKIKNISNIAIFIIVIPALTSCGVVFSLGNDYVSAGQSDELESPDTNVEEQQDEVNLDSRNEVEDIEGNNSGSENDVDGGSSTQTEIKELSGGNDNSKENTVKSKDKIAPKIINVKPNYGTINIPVTSTIEASFNEAVQKATVIPSTFLVKNPDGSMVSGAVSLSIDGKTALFTPLLVDPALDLPGLAGYSTIKSQTARCSEGEIISGGGYELSSSALGQNIPSYSSPQAIQHGKFKQISL